MFSERQPSVKLAGIEASALTPQAWAPDFSGIG